MLSVVFLFNWEKPKDQGKKKKKNFFLATISPAAEPRRLYAMDSSFCAVASGMPPQYDCRPPPSRQLELQLHGDFHKLTEAAPPIG